jgi:molybdopterin-guanine dinucleotide biosynthesis protein A
MTTEQSITLAVIAGGAGSRMGVPKTLLTVNAQPILEYLIDRFSWPGPTLLVTSPGREHPPGHERFHQEASDPVPNQGPLRGLLTALQHTTTDRIIAITVDMPLVTKPQLLWLIDQTQIHPHALGLMLKHPDREIERIEPFPMALRTAARDLLNQRLNTHNRSIHALAQLPEFSLLDAPTTWPPETWTNLNHPADLEAFTQSHPSTRVIRA